MCPKLIIIEKDKYLGYPGMILSIDKNHETYFSVSGSPCVPPHIPPFLYWLLDEIEYNTNQGLEIILDPAQKLDEIEKQFDGVKIFEIGLPEQNEGRDAYRKIIWVKAFSITTQKPPRIFRRGF
ncbi:MAG: hypothetical protein U9P90_03270 [Patescibacteria group bacterium]|nr:hypothetical protein [Patescibacteria group bacterium]